MIPRVLVAAVALTFSAACAGTPAPPIVDSVPEVMASPTASPLPPMTAEQAAKLDKWFPRKDREVLMRAEKIEIFAVNSDPACLRPKLESPTPDRFQGCEITRRAVVSDPERKKEFLGALFFGIGTAVDPQACFAPHHGIRAEFEGRRVEIIICFLCRNFRGISNRGEFDGHISQAAETAFENAGVGG